MVTREWPTQSRIWAAVAGPSFSARPTACVGVEVQVELGLRGAGQLGEGLGLADAEGSWSPAVLRSAAVAQIRSYRVVRVIVSPVTWSSLVPAYSVGFGWCRVTSQVAFERSSRVACSSGMCLAMAWATVRSRRVTPRVCSRGARTRSTWAAAFTVRAWVFWATRRARQIGRSSVWARRQVCGSRWTRSRASADQRHRRARWGPRGRGRGVRARTRPPSGVPSPPRDSSVSRSPSPPQAATPVSGVAGCRTHHW